MRKNKGLTPAQKRKAEEKTARDRQRRRSQLSPWRFVDKVQAVAREAGEHALADWISRYWHKLVPMVEQSMARNGFNIGANECGTGVLPLRTEAYRDRIKADTSTLLPLAEYDKIIIGLSGGKDSVACALVMIERCKAQGIDPAEKIELWHHLVDGHPERLLKTLEMESSKYIGDAPTTHPQHAKRVAKVRGQQEKRQAALSLALAEAKAANDGKAAEKIEGKLAKLQTKREADVAPILVTDAVLDRWKADVGDALRPVLSKTGSMFDWPCSHSYCIALADHLGLPLRFQWRQGGILGGILRTNSGPEPRFVQLGAYGTPEGNRTASPRLGKGLGTRRMFPQVSADLQTRWCSSYAKIELGAAGITADPRFSNAKVLMVTGERREEGGNRSKYATVERHKATTKQRRVDQYRAVLDCTEVQVWEVMRRYGIMPHPCYWLGFSRASCATCIFLRNDEWSTVKELLPHQFEAIARLEELTGLSIGRDGVSVRDQAQNHRSFAPVESDWRAVAADPGPYKARIYIDPGEWAYPMGAFRQGHGPT